jgi:hypothetical protein
MLVLYLLKKYLRRKTDPQFVVFWEHQFLRKIRYYIFAAILYYAFVVGVMVEILLWGNDSFLFGILVFMVVAVLYGGALFRYMFRFFGEHNQRYILIKSGFQDGTFDKSNVIN